METSDTVAIGIVLLLIVPLLFVEMPAYRRGGYTADFWRLPLDDKLDHIATQPEHWSRMGVVWLPILVLSAAGMTAFALQLAAAGSETLSYLALGAFLIGSAAWLFGSLVQTSTVRRAAMLRAETGSTPEWLQAAWDAAWWSELTFVVATNTAFVALGFGMLDAGFPADWTAWVALAGGGIALAMVVFAREAFPHLGVLVPIVIGVALVIY